ncbi:unnamed protein product [Linum trigynum]|uniref:Uncharacterized protein n=1 Tax=Linum trigynum TaxID=586398 RepID=A0AAV2GMT8_9ROSI
MGSEEKKSAAKKRLKAVEFVVDSDDDESIGSLIGSLLKTHEAMGRTNRVDHPGLPPAVGSEGGVEPYVALRTKE